MYRNMTVVGKGQVQVEGESAHKSQKKWQDITRTISAKNTIQRYHAHKKRFFAQNPENNGPISVKTAEMKREENKFYFMGFTAREQFHFVNTVSLRGIMFRRFKLAVYTEHLTLDS